MVGTLGNFIDFQLRKDIEGFVAELTYQYPTMLKPETMLLTKEEVAYLAKHSKELLDDL